MHSPTSCQKSMRAVLTALLCTASFSTLPTYAQYTRCANWYQGGKFICTNIQNTGQGYINCPNNLCTECMDGAGCLGGANQRCIFPQGGQCYMTYPTYGPITEWYDSNYPRGTQFYYQDWMCASACLDTQPCTVCGSGTYLKDCGGTNPGICAPCSKCGPGTIYSDGCATYALGGWPYDTICSICPKGKYSDQEHNLVCTPCPYGTSSFVDGGSSVASCIACPTGKFINSVDGSCGDCPIGSFSASPGLLSCSLCPAGKYGPNSSLSVCVNCLSGSYSAVLGAVDSSVCTACLPGTYTTTGASCLLCPQGKYGPNSLQTACLNCPAGMSSVAGLINSTGCTACPPGTYTVTGLSCLLCPVGRYGSNSSATVCVFCPPGMYNSITGASDSSSCMPCAITSFGTGGLCWRCAEGGYSTQAGATRCHRCDLGKYHSVFQGVSSSAECLQCPDGTYTFQTFVSFCRRCDSGTFHYNIRSVNSTFCCTCAPGSYSTRLASTMCTLCSPGTYSSVPRQTRAASCIGCDAGTYSAEGAGICCAPGSYSLTGIPICCQTGLFLTPCGTICQVCQPGSYISESLCVQCPNSTYSLQNSATACRSCAYCSAGSYAFACGGGSMGSCTPCTVW